MSTKRISVPEYGGQENRAMADVLKLIRSGRTGLEAGAFQQNLLTPALLGEAGYDVDYVDRSADLQAAQQKVADLAAAQQQINEAKLLRGGKKKEAMATLREKYGVKGKKLQKYLKSQRGLAERELGDISAAPLQIRGIKERADVAAQKKREQDILRQEQEMLQKSLSMTPEDVLAADPALRRQLEEEQAKLEQAQVGQFGSLRAAQGGTVGAVQSAAMAQRRAEAIANARRENIGLYAGLQTAQGANMLQQGAQRQQMGAFPGALQQTSAMNFGNLAQQYGLLFNRNAQQRQLQFQANAFNQTQPTLTEKVLAGVGSLFDPFKKGGQ